MDLELGELFSYVSLYFQRVSSRLSACRPVTHSDARMFLHRCWIWHVCHKWSGTRTFCTFGDGRTFEYQSCMMQLCFLKKNVHSVVFCIGFTLACDIWSNKTPSTGDVFGKIRLCVHLQRWGMRCGVPATIWNTVSFNAWTWQNSRIAALFHCAVLPCMQAILCVSATKEIIHFCYRAREGHVTFQLLFMAELSTFWFVWNSRVDIQLLLGELAWPDSLHFVMFPRDLELSSSCIEAMGACIRTDLWCASNKGDRVAVRSSQRGRRYFSVVNRCRTNDFFSCCCDSSVDIHTKFGELFSPMSVHFLMFPRGCMRTLWAIEECIRIELGCVGNSAIEPARNTLFFRCWLLQN